MRLLAVLASFAAVIGLAVPAHGDPGGDDADFLAPLERAGVPYTDGHEAVAGGKAVGPGDPTRVSMAGATTLALGSPAKKAGSRAAVFALVRALTVASFDFRPYAPLRSSRRMSTSLAAAVG